jgi:hypothetical protein
LTRNKKKKDTTEEGADANILLLGEKEKTILELIEGKRVLCSDIKSDFNHLDLNKLISLATKD